MKELNKIRWKWGVFGSLLGYLFITLLNHLEAISVGSESDFISSFAMSGFIAFLYAILFRPQMILVWFFPIFVILLISNSLSQKSRIDLSVDIKNIFFSSIIQSLIILFFSILIYFVIIFVLYAFSSYK